MEKLPASNYDIIADKLLNKIYGYNYNHSVNPPCCANYKHTLEFTSDTCAMFNNVVKKLLNYEMTEREVQEIDCIFDSIFLTNSSDSGNAMSILMKLCNDDNHAHVYNLLNNKHLEFNVNQINREKQTALMYAASSSKRCVDILLSNGANVNMEDKYGCTALIFAAKYGIASVIDVLASKCDDVNATDIRGMTALMWINNAPIGTTILIEHLAEMNIQDHNGMTALMHMARKGYAQCMHILLLHGANRHLKDKKGMTVLMYSVYHPECLMCLLASNCDLYNDDDYDLNAKDNRGRTAIMMPEIEMKSLEMLALAGADLNIKDNTGSTALMYMASAGYYECVNILIEYGANKNIQDWNGLTALMRAIPHPDSVENILWRLPNASCHDRMPPPLNLNLKDNCGQTALKYAENYPECLSLILAYTKM